MKTLFVLIGLGAFSAVISCGSSPAKKNQPENMANGFAVVELFTSEGCSSCPPADKAVEALLKKNNNNVYVLGYHVDYWDNLEWKDVFSNAAYTQIQRGYAKAFKLSSVYTPQIVVNGKEQFVGSNENKLNAAVNEALQDASNIKLEINAADSNDNKVVVHYSTDAVNADVHIALIELAAEHKIQRGENSGATLHHINIVRDIKVVPVTQNGIAVLLMPAGLHKKDCSVIAFIQNKTDNTITAAAEVNIN